MKARAAVSDGRGSFSIQEIEVHAPHANEVVVEIQASGVCHTDYDGLNHPEPAVMGHEGSGIVKEVGSQVTSVRRGDHVLLNWAIPCGHCFQCVQGNRHLCENHNVVTAQDPGRGSAHEGGTTLKGKPIGRSFNIGTMSTVALVREEAVIPVDIDIPHTSACIIGCGVMTGFGSVVNAAKVIPGSSVVVLGTGGVGLNVIQGARISGAEKIIAVDINENRLELACEFGATHTVLARREDDNLLEASRTIKQMTHGRGADYAFECTAIAALGAAPLAMIRNAGVAVQVSGIEEEITIDMNLFEWDKTYINPLYGQCNPQVDFPRILQLYRKGELKLDEMVTQTYPLEDLGKAFDDMLSGKNAKGVLVME